MITGVDCYIKANEVIDEWMIKIIDCQCSVCQFISCSYGRRLPSSSLSSMSKTHGWGQNTIVSNLKWLAAQIHMRNLEVEPPFSIVDGSDCWTDSRISLMLRMTLLRSPQVPSKQLCEKLYILRSASLLSVWRPMNLYTYYNTRLSI